MNTEEFPLTPESLAFLQALYKSQKSYGRAPAVSARELGRLLMGKYLSLKGGGTFRITEKGLAAMVSNRERLSERVS